MQTADRDSRRAGYRFGSDLAHPVVPPPYRGLPPVNGVRVRGARRRAADTLRNAQKRSGMLRNAQRHSETLRDAQERSKTRRNTQIRGGGHRSRDSGTCAGPCVATLSFRYTHWPEPQPEPEPLEGERVSHSVLTGRWAHGQWSGGEGQTVHGNVSFYSKTEEYYRAPPTIWSNTRKQQSRTTQQQYYATR